MEHEVGVSLLTVDIVEKLLVADSSKSCYSKGLCLSSCEEGTAVCAWKDTNLTGDRSDFSNLSSISSYTVVKDGSTEDVILHVVEHLDYLTHSLWILGNES